MAGPGSGGAWAPPRTAIVGLGLIGTSIGLALRRRHPEAFLVGIDREERIDHPRIAETFTDATTELSRVSGVDLIVLATPIDSILEILPSLPSIAPGACITDTGSTKRAVLSAARAAGADRFVGGHPMAGSDRSGPDAARADLFDARPWFLVGGGAVRADVGAFVRTLGATPIFMDDGGEDHDRLMAAVSHLPQIVITALMARVGETVGSDGLGYAGTGLRDTTRLAASEARVWESILATNADAIGPLLRELAADLESIAGSLGDHGAVRRLFGLANMYRREL